MKWRYFANHEACPPIRNPEVVTWTAAGCVETMSSHVPVTQRRSDPQVHVFQLGIQPDWCASGAIVPSGIGGG